MNKEDKELLLKDLCARLPYGIQINLGNDRLPSEVTAVSSLFGIKVIGKRLSSIYDNGPYWVEAWRSIDECIPYLRSMSSMTEEECIELSRLKPNYDKVEAWKYIKTPVPLTIANIEQFDFFNSHHLDWRGLIPKGLALEASEDMYKF